MKIGLGLITYNRPAFFNLSCSSAMQAVEGCAVHHFVVVNDGTPYDGFKPSDGMHLIQRPKNGGVACAKNDALRSMMAAGCDICFLMEDDIIIRKSSVFNAYVEAMKCSNIQHFNFGYHGLANMRDGKPWARMIVRYNENVYLSFNRHCVGAFSMYSKECLDKVGLMDERFVNAWEHVDHTLRIIQAGFHPPFWWFADILNSHEYLGEIASSEVRSSIRERSDWQMNINRGTEIFVQAHGCVPVRIPDVGNVAVQQYLKSAKGISR
nr:glycosyltransferase subfamily GT2 protein [Candidatus Sigynarchaeota archaeon]